MQVPRIECNDDLGEFMMQGSISKDQRIGYLSLAMEDR